MNWNDETLLEVVEMYASEQGWIDSEDALSQHFDAMIDEMKEGMTAKEWDNLVGDTIAFDEMFSNMSDSLCKDGAIHFEQYNTYQYVGKYS